MTQPEHDADTELGCISPGTLQSFDEMLLMKRGGRIIYFGPLGPCSCHMVQYFEVCPRRALLVFLHLPLPDTSMQCSMHTAASCIWYWICRVSRGCLTSLTAQTPLPGCAHIFTPPVAVSRNLPICFVTNKPSQPCQLLLVTGV